MFRPKRIPFLLPVCLGLAALLAPAAQAQLNSTAATVTLNATLTETLTVAATPNNVSITLVSGGPATTTTAVAITTSWTLKSSRSSVVLYSSFATPSAALTDGGTNTIPSSLVYGQVASGTPTSYTAYTQSNTLGTASGGLLLFTQAISSSNRNSSRSDNLYFKIDLTSVPQQSAGTYTGVVTLQAQAS